MNRLTQWSATALLLFLLLWQIQSSAIENIQIEVKQWMKEQVQAKGFELTFHLGENGLGMTARAQQMILPPPFNIVRKVHFDCSQLQWRSGQVSCKSGKLLFEHKELGQQNLEVAFAVTPEAELYQIHLSGLKLAEGHLDVDMNMNHQHWQAQLEGNDISLAKLGAFAHLWLNEQQIALLSDWQYQGQIDIDAELAGQAENLHQLNSRLKFKTLSFSNQAGTQVAENLSAEVALKLQSKISPWHWQVDAKLKEGQAYSDPVFLDYSTEPVSLSAQGTWDSSHTLLDVTQLLFEQQSVLTVQAQLRLKASQLQQLKFKTKTVELANLYPVWIQPFTVGTAADKLDMKGKAAVDFALEHEHYRLRLDMDSVAVTDENKRFSIDGVTGRVGWSTDEQIMESNLSWQQAQVYAVDIGAAELKAQSQHAGLRLSQSLDLPVLDGKLLIQEFELEQDQQQKVAWRFEGLLTPISMESLSQALDWPLLHGKISGVIPRVSYKQQSLKVDGALQMKVFDGTTVIRDLQMTSPLGSLPQLYANIDIDNMDLELLTQTFDFGRITGRLDGYVHQLRLSNWQPVQFDAYLATPEDNPGKRRISQKAVDNLSQIGGGASGLLSRSFLRFFEDFSYQKLGLSCQLRNETCEMSGIEEAKQGYYIVKGGGGLPPWINVVGYTRRVNWTDLIERLKAVNESSGPVVQ